MRGRTLFGRANIATLAWRNIWRNRRRTAITLAGIAFGVFLTVLAVGVNDGLFRQMIDYAAKAGGGHVSVQHREYLDFPSLEKSLIAGAKLTGTARGDSSVVRVVPRLSGAAMLSTAANSAGTFFQAIDPTLEDEQTLPFFEAIREGEMFEGPASRGIILGATLAENLEVTVGKKVVYTVTDRRGQIVSALARVKGVVRTGSLSVDGGLCLLPIDSLRTLIGYEPDEQTQLAVFLNDFRHARGVQVALEGATPADAVALTWRETLPDLERLISTKLAGLLVVEGILFALIAAGIFNTLFVSVMERLREFGIMTALGFTSRQLFLLVMWESFWLAVVGLGVAGAVTAGPYYYLSTVGIDTATMFAEGTEVAGIALDPVMKVGIYPEHLAVICGLVFLSTLTAGLYPAWRAGRVPPAEAIREI